MVKQKVLSAQNFKKATLIGVAFCFAHPALSELPDFPASVKQARENLMNGDRKKALSMINYMITNEENTEKNRELITEGRKLGTFFITESGQKLFELGESMSDTNPPLAEEKYKESLKEEGPNLKILNALSLLKLRGNHCDEARQWNQKALDTFDRMIEVQAIAMQVLACEDNFEGISKKLEGFKEDSPVLQIPVVQLLTARAKIQSGMVKQGLEILRLASETKNAFPDVWYWRWKLDPEEGHIQRTYLEKYITICKKMTPRLKRKYRESGVVCEKLPEAEKALKKSGANSDESLVN